VKIATWQVIRLTSFSFFILRLRKLQIILLHPMLRRALFKNMVMAGVEHKAVINRPLSTIVDIGANRGQFSLAARQWAPQSKIISFEPLAAPAALFRKVFASDDSIKLYEAAIGPTAIDDVMHISARDDSSSLLPISSLQDKMFPGTSEVGTVNVRVAPLCTFVNESDIVSPAMLKLDVQGYELDALRGCESLLHKFDWIYCECSFVELYSGQSLAADVINWLFDRGFTIQGFYNPSYDRDGQAIQADFLFRKS
jgi:FkbM family methyltransferase